MKIWSICLSTSEILASRKKIPEVIACHRRVGIRWWGSTLQPFCLLEQDLCLVGENFAVSCKGGSFVYQDLFPQYMHCFKTKYAGCAEIILSRINGVQWR